MVWGDTSRFCSAFFSLWSWCFDRSGIQGTNASKPCFHHFEGQCPLLLLCGTLGQFNFGHCNLYGIFGFLIKITTSNKRNSNSWIAFQKVSSKPNATKKVILRTIKLFLLGILLQGMFSCLLLFYYVSNQLKLVSKIMYSLVLFIHSNYIPDLYLSFYLLAICITHHALLMEWERKTCQIVIILTV